jgi:hypothetical protein
MPKAVTISELLEFAPLYASVEVQGHGFHGNLPTIALPDVIRRSCRKCDGVNVLWNRGNNLRHPAVTEYRCANCHPANDASMVTFALRWDLQERRRRVHGPLGEDLTIDLIGTVTKFGEFPEISVAMPKRLQNRLGHEHAEFYRQARRLRNFSLGIAAMVYLRRVVEETVHQLIDIIANAADDEGYKGVSRDEIEEVKQSRIFKEKVELAKRALPHQLLVGDHNPLDTLFSVTSEGLHQRSEEECVAAFDAATNVFEYFFEELPARHERHAVMRKAVAAFGSHDKTWSTGEEPKGQDTQERPAREPAKPVSDG